MKHFTINELTYSDTARNRGIDNTPDAKTKTALTELVDNVLDPLREAYGKPIQVNSGYRSPELNKAVGGASTSQHMKGEAADITAGSKSENKKLFELVQSLGLPFTQLIDEKKYSWIHISYDRNSLKRQILHL